MSYAASMWGQSRAEFTFEYVRNLVGRRGRGGHCQMSCEICHVFAAWITRIWNCCSLPFLHVRSQLRNAYLRITGVLVYPFLLHASARPSISCLNLQFTTRAGNSWRSSCLAQLLNLNSLVLLQQLWMLMCFLSLSPPPWQCKQRLNIHLFLFPCLMLPFFNACLEMQVAKFAPKELCWLIAF